MSGDDRRFRRLFDAQRADDARATPPFDTTWAAARRKAAARGTSRRSRVAGWTWATAAAAVLLLAVVAGTRHGPRVAAANLEREIALAREITSWRGPTSGLGALTEVPVYDDGLELTSVAVPDGVGLSSAEEMERAGDQGAGGTPAERNTR